MQTKHRLALVMPYYGKLPSYFPYYLKSLSRIRMDLVFFTDLEFADAPANLHVIKMSFAELRRLASEKLGVSVGMETPKKLCDFKPMYGKIFEDYLRDYDYWAMGDCDVVYGTKFNEIIDLVLTGKYDVISLRKKWLSGSFCALRNTSKVNELYMRAKNWQEVATENGPNNLFDECGGPWHAALSSGKMTMADCEKRRDSFGAVVWRSKDITLWHENQIAEDGLCGHTVKMNSDGKLYRDGEEILLFHFVGIKFRRYCRFPLMGDNIQELLIDDAGMYSSARSLKFHALVKAWRKASSIVESVRENGVAHWVKRVLAYKAMIIKFFHFAASSVGSMVIDLSVFSLVCLPLEVSLGRASAIGIAIPVARVVSGHCNYFYNQHFVFRAISTWKSYFQYWGLVLLNMTMLMGWTQLWAHLLDASGWMIPLLNFLGEVCLFLFSFTLQHFVIFRNKKAGAK